MALAFILNLPWTIAGLLCAVISIPYRIRFRAKPTAIIFNVRSYWWYSWLPGKRGVRACAIGHVVLLGPMEMTNDLEHELIHVEQAEREPLVRPLLYFLETMRHGYRRNKYEDEAYRRAGNVYKGKDY
jgi:hypothetical protein